MLGFHFADVPQNDGFPAGSCLRLLEGSVVELPPPQEVRRSYHKATPCKAHGWLISILLNSLSQLDPACGAIGGSSITSNDGRGSGLPELQDLSTLKIPSHPNSLS